MLSFPRTVRVFACAEPTDMRCGADRLSAQVQQALGYSVLAGDLFLFVSRNRHRAKIVYWDGTGLCLFAKRLAKGVFAAPWQGSRHKPWCLTMTELQLFLEGSRLIGQVAVSPPAYTP